MRMNWDDFRLFNILARTTTIRAAASVAGISHSTLSRRMDALEAQVGAQLFSRGPRGFQLTAQGRAFQTAVAQAEVALDDGLRTITGADDRLAGQIKLTLPDFVAYYCVLDQLPAFQAQYPDITLDIDVSYDTANLTRREADVAIRFVPIGTTPDDVLVGRKVGQSHAAGYATQAYLKDVDLSSPQGGAAWLGWSHEDSQDWIERTPYPYLPIYGYFNHAELQHHAARAGLGISYLPSCIGEADPDLVRLPNMSPMPARDIWVLTHADLRKTQRMKVFRDWLVDTLRNGNL